MAARAAFRLELRLPCLCQHRFRDYTSPDRRKTLAKCIDEFNFTKNLRGSCVANAPLQGGQEPADNLSNRSLWWRS
jgi:hypothetical protein